MTYRTPDRQQLQPGRGWLLVRRAGFLVVSCCLAAIVAGCAALPRTLPLPDDDASQVRRQFKTMLDEQGRCPAAIDSDVTATIDNLLWTGTLSGYLRAMAPAFVRFEGVNPLGLTEAILAVDGENFTYVSVRNQHAYLGPLKAELLDRYAPDGLATAMSYYWLLGRVPPGSLGIGEVGRDPDGQGYWVDLRYSESGKHSMILYAPEQRLIKRHLVLNGHDAISVDLDYEYPQAATTDCQLPSRIIIQGRGNGRINLAFTKRYPTPSLDKRPFFVIPPPDYKKTEVQ